MPEIKKGSTNVTRYIEIVDSTAFTPETGVTITNLDLQYTRYGADPVAKVDATALSATDDAHTDNKAIEVDGTSSPGLYRVDWPDAAFATGVDGVVLVVSGSGFKPAVENITLVDNVVADALDASDRVDVGSWLGTVVTTSASTSKPEVDADSMGNVKGAGFSTGTDSLKEIRDAIDTLVAPAVVGASALSGSGFLSDCVTLVRRSTDEPSLTPKYTDSDIVEHITSAMTAVISEIHNNTDHNIICRFDITLVSGQQTYILPPNVGEIWAVRKMSTTTPITPIYEVWSDNHWSSHQSGFVVEHNEFRLLTDWRSTDTLEILYVPNGESHMHLGTAVSATASTIVFAVTPTDGTLDTRANAYGGYLVRLLSDTTGYVQERIIDSYDNTAREATLTTDWDPTPTGTIVYEVLPTYSNIIKHCVCMNAAMDIMGNEASAKRMQTLERRYLAKVRALRQMIAKKSSRFGGYAIGDTSDNDSRGDFYGWIV